MKLQQNQLWRQGERYYRILKLDRVEVEYRELKDPEHKHGKNLHLSKKEFCRLIKKATVVEG